MLVSVNLCKIFRQIFEVTDINLGEVSYLFISYDIIIIF